MVDFWKDGLSVDEAKVSLIGICFLVGFLFSLVMYYFDRNITDNLLTLDLFLAGGILGINGLNVAKDTIIGAFGKKE